MKKIVFRCSIGAFVLGSCLTMIGITIWCNTARAATVGYTERSSMQNAYSATRQMMTTGYHDNDHIARAILAASMANQAAARRSPISRVDAKKIMTECLSDADDIWNPSSRGTEHREITMIAIALYESRIAANDE